MTLVVMGRESLAELEQLVSEYFAAIPNRQVKREPIVEPLIEKERLPLQLTVEPDKNKRELSFLFPTPDIRPHYRAKPLQYIGHIVGHEGAGSLLSLL